MGLDMYAYVAARAGQQHEFYDGSAFNKETGDFENPKVSKPRELAYWRKHPNLHGWMEKLAERKNLKYNLLYDSFNGIELELTYEDLEMLELDIIAGTLPDTTGFFFGQNANDLYQTQDLEFIRNARAELFLGLRVFYNSSW
jgi:hypothetical protein